MLLLEAAKFSCIAVSIAVLALVLVSFLGREGR
jgi:hypothetical protein